MTPTLPNELDVVRDVSARLDDAGIAFMLTGSLAMNYYAEPRMTRDVDLVVGLREADVARVASLFADGYYVDTDAIAEAVAHYSSFNAIHEASVIKVDCFPRKPDAFHVAEFERRRRVVIGDFETSLVTREDLILSKLLWARTSGSETQLRDVRNLTLAGFDEAYVRAWVARLALSALWEMAAR